MKKFCDEVRRYRRRGDVSVGQHFLNRLAEYFWLDGDGEQKKKAAEPKVAFDGKKVNLIDMNEDDGAGDHATSDEDRDF